MTKETLNLFIELLSQITVRPIEDDAAGQIAKVQQAKEEIILELRELETDETNRPLNNTSPAAD